ncbi:MAG: hypothetical protein P9X24_16060 [Candidatus Hatepunaea meridiana]|nr:hypothetical protein [Candidatus Hatepunaea meridiana]
MIKPFGIVPRITFLTLSVFLTTVSMANAVGFQILSFPIDARSVSLGETGVSNIQGVSAINRNPAGLGFISSLEVQLCSSTNCDVFLYGISTTCDVKDYAENTQANYLAFGIAERVSESFTYGIGIANLNYDEDSKPGHAHHEDISLRGFESMLTVAVGYSPEKFDRNLCFGVALKHAIAISPSSENTKFTNYMGYGAMYRLPINSKLKLIMGVNLDNIGKHESHFYNRKPQYYPVDIQSGFTVALDDIFLRAPIQGKWDFNFTVEMERELDQQDILTGVGSFYKDVWTQITRKDVNDLIHHFGFETIIENSFAMRIGYMEISSYQKRYSCGIGLLFKRCTVDLALRDAYYPSVEGRINVMVRLD